MNAILKHRAHGVGRRPQRGAVAITFGITAIVLVGFIGLALDLGRFFVIKAELQNAMDACALSAASQLKPGANDPNALTRAVAYGKVFITGGIADAGTSKPGNDANIKNTVNFQSVVPDTNVIEITFAATNNGTYQTAADADSNTAKFVKCDYPLAGLPVLFMRVLNPARDTQMVRATAVATREIPTSSCIPISICRNPGDADYVKGDWIVALGDNDTSGMRGFFGWVDFVGGNGDLAGKLRGSESCDLSRYGLTSAGGNGLFVDRQPGNNASLDAAWNSRFGWYQNPLDASSAAPDKTGFAYSWNSATAQGNWPAGANAYDGSPGTYPGGATATTQNFETARANYSPYQITPNSPNDPQPPGIGGAPGANTRTPVASSVHEAIGRVDKRIVAAPVVNCSTWTTPGGPPVSVQIEDWACLLMLNPYVNAGQPTAVFRKAKVEFLGYTTKTVTPCAAGSEFAVAPVLSQ